MANKDYEVLRGTFTVVEGKEKVSKGPGATLKMGEEDAARFVEAGQLIEAGSKPKATRGKSAELKTAEARISQLEGEVASITTAKEEAEHEAETLERVLAKLAVDHGDVIEAAKLEVATELDAEANQAAQQG